MNLYSIYRTPSKPLPRWVMNAGAVLVCLVGLPILIVWHYAKAVAVPLEGRGGAT